MQTNDWLFELKEWTWQLAGQTDNKAHVYLTSMIKRSTSLIIFDPSNLFGHMEVKKQKMISSLKTICNMNKLTRADVVGHEKTKVAA